MDKAEKVLLQLDEIAMRIATQPHGVPNRIPVWTYNADALESWWTHVINEDLPLFEPKQSEGVKKFLRSYERQIMDTLHDKNRTGYLPPTLIDPSKNITFTNTQLELSLTGLLRPSAVFVKMLSMLQDVATHAGLAGNGDRGEITHPAAMWIMQAEKGEEGTLRRCFVFLAVRMAVGVLVNSRLADIGEDVVVMEGRRVGKGVRFAP